MDSFFTEYFTFEEFLYGTSGSGAIDSKYQHLIKENLTAEIENNLRRLYTALVVVRKAHGAPFYVHCTFRPIPYEKLKGRSGESWHTKGLAIDFHTSDMEKLANILDKTWVGGFHYYPDEKFIHLDIRGKKARW